MFVTLFEDKQAVNPGITQAGYVWDPMGEVATQPLLEVDKGKYLQFQVQIGSNLYPVYPISSLEEAYYQLRKM